MKNKIAKSTIIYITLSVFVVLLAVVYTNHKDDVEYKKAIGVISRYLDSCDWDNLDNRVFSWDYDVLFFGKNANTMFENTPIPGKRDEMGFVKGVLFDGRFKDNVDWSQQWDGVYSLYELKDFLDEKWIGPNKIEADQDRIDGITPHWMFDLSYLGWRINEMYLDLSGRVIHESVIYPYEVAYLGNSELGGKPSVADALNEAFDYAYYYPELESRRASLEDVSYLASNVSCFGCDYYRLMSGKDIADFVKENDIEDLDKVIKRMRLRRMFIRDLAVDRMEYRCSRFYDNGIFRVNCVRRNKSRWALNYNIFDNPKRRDRNRIILCGEVILLLGYGIVFYRLSRRKE